MMVSLVFLSEFLKHFAKAGRFYQLTSVFLRQNFIKLLEVEMGLFPFRFFRLALKSPVKHSF